MSFTDTPLSSTVYKGEQDVIMHYNATTTMQSNDSSDLVQELAFRILL